MKEDLSAQWYNNSLNQSYCVCGKKCYDKKGARGAKNHRFKEDHIELRIYPCDLCKYWHLTKEKFIKR